MNGVSNDRRFECLPSNLFRLISKATSKFRITGSLWGDYPPLAGEFPSQRASNAKKSFHVMTSSLCKRCWLCLCHRWQIRRASSCRAHTRLAPSQWETPLQSNVVSHGLGADLESSLLMPMFIWLYNQFIIQYIARAVICREGAYIPGIHSATPWQFIINWCTIYANMASDYLHFQEVKCKRGPNRKLHFA